MCYDEWFVMMLLVDDGRVCGLVVIELVIGCIEMIFVDVVILCIGGCGWVFLFIINVNIKIGDGMVFVFCVGVFLKDMEFV